MEKYTPISFSAEQKNIINWCRNLNLGQIKNLFDDKKFLSDPHSKILAKAIFATHMKSIFLENFRNFIIVNNISLRGILCDNSFSAEEYKTIPKDARKWIEKNVEEFYLEYDPDLEEDRKFLYDERNKLIFAGEN